MIFLLIPVLVYLKRKFKFKITKKVFNSKQSKIVDKTYLNKWMNLTKKERFKLSSKESVSYSKKRKVLLEEIRQEYKKISNKSKK